MGGPRIAFRIGPLAIAWYGIILVFAAIVAAYVAEREAKRRGDDPEHVWNAFLLCLLFGVIGARLYHVISSLDYYLQNPMQILNTRAGGLGIIGGVIGGTIGLWIYTRRGKLDFWHWADIAVPGLLLAQAIGRWGNYVNHELYGYPTTLPWGIYIPPAYRLPGFENYERFHPTFLYESLWNLAGFLLALYIARRWAGWLRNGDLFFFYGIYYSTGRFITEFQRPDAWTIGPLATAQWISIVAAAACAILLYLRHRQPLPAPVITDTSAQDTTSESQTAEQQDQA